MEWLNSGMEFVNGPGFAALVSGLFLISEALAFIPQVKANGIFQAIYNGLGALKSKVKPAA